MTTINQKEYLKKYLGIGKGSGVKKKKTKSGGVLGKSLKIIDDDVDAAAALSKEIQDDLANHNEDAPQIVAVIDDRPPSLRIDEKTKDNLWKPIGQVADSDLLSTHPGIKKDLSPSRKRKQSDYDYSPSRKSSKNQSPSRKSKSKWDVSPPMGVHEDVATRIKVEQDDISSPWKSPSRRTQRNIEVIPSHDSKEDISPPRNSKCNVSSGQNSRDMSPQRKVGRNKDYSPQRKSRNPNIEISSQNSRYISPPRKVERNDSPRKSRKANSSSYSRKNEETRVSRWNRNSPRTENNDNTIQAEKIEKTLSGKKSGLQNAKDLVQEIITLRQNEELLFKNMSHEVSGQNAITISRKKKTTTAEEDAKAIENKKEMEVKYSKWGKGIKQVQDTLGKNEDILHEMSKPLARYADDEDLEQYLKKQERDGDPMLAYIRKKKKKKQVEAGIPEKPMYLGDFEPNRFGIKPGYRWDGVDRSNGYEKKLFESKNSKEAAEEDAMKWNTEDM